VLLYYITDRTQFPGPEHRRRERLLEKMAEAARAGVDYIQLREKDLPARELELLARDAVRICRETGNEKRETKLLVNSRSDIALASGADGVHLPTDDVLASDARAIWSAVLTRNLKLEAPCGREAERSEAGRPQEPAPSEVEGKSGAERGSCVIAVSCHSLDEVRLAEAHGADFAVFGPIFEKRGTSLSVGLDALRAACHRSARGDRKTEAVEFGTMPVLAIGGITVENARACFEAGAAGIAAIRLFQQHDISSLVEEFRQIDDGVARAPAPAKSVPDLG
jgi:thiamine-phosphate pyrophosphorylase